MISPYDPSIAAWLSVTDNSFVGKLAPTSSEFLCRNIFGLQTFTLEPDVPSKGGWHPYIGEAEPFRELRVSGHLEVFSRVELGTW